MAIVLGFALVALAASIVAAYAAWLATAPRRSGAAGFHPADVLIVVPTYDEAALIERKLENLAALTYAKRQVVLVDGGSTDGTLGRISRWIAARDGFTLLETRHRDKTAQLNDALAAHPGAGWVLVTDADAALAPDAIERLLEVADRQVGVVGASVRPDAAHALESLHWRATDWLRDREYDRGSAGIVA
ncbi:MAG TPA: glycosyltransferase, partial [Thermoanaerobaculia bacterium]|nr:glycosyltransferase [Thermoanaerobaculia bacterium]